MRCFHAKLVLWLACLVVAFGSHSLARGATPAGARGAAAVWGAGALGWQIPGAQTQPTADPTASDPLYVPPYSGRPLGPDFNEALRQHRAQVEEHNRLMREHFGRIRRMQSEMGMEPTVPDPSAYPYAQPAPEHTPPTYTPPTYTPPTYTPPTYTPPTYTPPTEYTSPYDGNAQAAAAPSAFQPARATRSSGVSAKWVLGGVCVGFFMVLLVLLVSLVFVLKLTMFEPQPEPKRYY